MSHYWWLWWTCRKARVATCRQQTQQQQQQQRRLLQVLAIVPYLLLLIAECCGYYASLCSSWVFCSRLVSGLCLYTGLVADKLRYISLAFVIYMISIISWRFAVSGAYYLFVYFASAEDLMLSWRSLYDCRPMQNISMYEWIFDEFLEGPPQGPID